MLSELLSRLDGLANPDKAKVLQRFFKTGKGEYGEGDVFLGITVPVQRALAKEFSSVLKFTDIEKLLKSQIHEHRLVGLLIMVDQYEKADTFLKQEIFSFYLFHTDRINNWDLVDLSAPKIVGDFLLTRPCDILYQMAKSRRLWDRRIAVLATFSFLRVGQFKDTLQLCEILLSDPHDLMHKACGWMLREVGKRDERELEQFLKKNSCVMPRTMLRYAIEKMDEKKRKQWLKK